MPQGKTKPARRKKPRSQPAEQGSSSEETGALQFPVVGIGASAGGLESFKQMLRALPADTGMAFVLIQHLGPTQHSMLAEILARETAMSVTDVNVAREVEPNHVYVITPGIELTISRARLEPTQRTEAPGHHRPIDVFLRSLAEELGYKSIGVILSGSSTDGTLGLEEVKAAGGITFAQDATAPHDSMPRSAAAAGCVDFVLPPDEIAREIARIARHPYVAPPAEEKGDLVLPEFNFGPVLNLLRDSKGVDFAHYKRNTLFRRITRRMVLHKIEGLKDYLALLQSNPAEVEALYQDILISVTSFFRNPESFETLKSEVFPRLVQGHTRHDAVRFWVVGCSTGEEAYSLAIAFSEFLELTGRHFLLQIFATDLNAAYIEKARAGVYSKNIVEDVSPERLRRYFIETEGSYRIRKAIRDMCVFARHNVLTDPPFSRTDLVSCRNLLIYLGQEVQQRVVPILHYALRPDGFLWLGASETIGSYRDLFELDDVKHKIYRKKPAQPRLTFSGVGHGTPSEAHPGGGKPRPRREVPIGGTDPQKEVDRFLLAKYAPPSVLVTPDLEILQFRGNTGTYLAPAPGRASLHLLRMLREGLVVAVRSALQKARKDDVPVRAEGLRVKANGGDCNVNVEVVPVKGVTPGGNCFLVLFEDAGRASERDAGSGRPKRTGKVRSKQERSDSKTDELKQELAATRDYLQSVIEQQEAANEELQSANEEVQSSNEELQSVNEELETSKEEVQSTNEELATVNEELRRRNIDLIQSNDDLVNLLASVRLAIVMLDPSLRIRRFTPAAEKMLNLIPADIGRPITDLNLNVAIPDLQRHLDEVIDKASDKEFDVRDREGHWCSLRLRPYRSVDNKIDGAVVVLIDIDTAKRNQATMNRQAELLEQVREPILMWELGGTIVYWNGAAEAVYGYTREQALDRRAHELLATSPSLEEFSDELKKEARWRGNLVHTRSDGQKLTVDSRMVLVREADGRNLVIEANRIS